VFIGSLFQWEQDILAQKQLNYEQGAKTLTAFKRDRLQTTNKKIKMNMVKHEEIWQKAFNKRCSKYHIVDFLLQDVFSCTFLTDDGKELRLTTNQNMYNFSSVLQRKKYKHVANIYDCFKIELPSERGELQNVFCVVSELLKRDFAPLADVQMGINLFRDSWIKCLSRKYHLNLNSYNDIDNAYSSKSDNGRKLVIETIKDANNNKTAKDVALAMEEAYEKVMKLDPDALIFPFSDNIGLAQDGIIKICNIGHKFMGLDDNYEIYTTSNSVTVVYNPCSDDVHLDNRLLMPLKVNIDGREALFLGQIDTGASSSGFTEYFYKEAELENFGIAKTIGATGEMDSISTRCLVNFPNGYCEPLYGSTIKKFGDISVLIGMDLISRCKFAFEPYRNGFKYKLTFPFSK